MILCLDVGNSQIYGGVFDGDDIKLQFRKNSRSGASSDEYGIFLRAVLKENSIDQDMIKQISICTVVPEVLHSLRNACKKYFDINPFVLQAGVKTGLKIKYRNPLEVGSDRIANAIAATHMFVNTNLVIIDFGTATTFCAVSKERDYLGGTIIAGLRLSMQSLETNTSKLPAVEIIIPESCMGRSTVESIQSGLFYSAIGAVKEITSRISREAFNGEKPLIISTGGFASLFQAAKTKDPGVIGLFDQEIPDLVLRGLFLALKLNT